MPLKIEKGIKSSQDYTVCDVQVHQESPARVEAKCPLIFAGN